MTPASLKEGEELLKNINSIEKDIALFESAENFHEGYVSLRNENGFVGNVSTFYLPFKMIKKSVLAELCIKLHELKTKFANL